jgi:hypothetical protein
MMWHPMGLGSVAILSTVCHGHVLFLCYPNNYLQKLTMI